MSEHDMILDGSNSASGRSMGTRVIFTGEYDLAAKEQLRDELDRLVNEPAAVLDFRDVSYIDSTCIAELMRNRDLRASHNLPSLTILMRPGNRIRRIFEILGLLSAFDFAEELPSYETQARYAFAGGVEEPNSTSPVASQQATVG